MYPVMAHVVACLRHHSSLARDLLVARVQNSCIVLGIRFVFVGLVSWETGWAARMGKLSLQKEGGVHHGGLSQRSRREATSQRSYLGGKHTPRRGLADYTVMRGGSVTPFSF